jgi:SAM-dependent methyltransferase
MNWGRTVIGADLCLNSLRLAKAFRDRCSIANAQFVQMNLFRPPFPDATFDLVVCNGVLHHTSDPRAGFDALARKVKPGGHVIIGLYNHLGRLPTLWRRALIERFGDRFASLDPRLRGSKLNTGRWAAWFMDQYRHPHESRHSIAEVSRWYDAAGFDVVFTIPPAGGETFTEDTALFDRRHAVRGAGLRRERARDAADRRPGRRALHGHRTETDLMATHEDFSRGQAVKQSGLRAFGGVFVVAFVLSGCGRCGRAATCASGPGRRRGAPRDHARRAGAARAAEQAVDAARRAAAPDREPDRARVHVLRRRHADRHAQARDVARRFHVAARRRRGHVLEAPRSARAQARQPHPPVLGTLMSFLAELWAYMRTRKKFWLLPIMLMMVVLGALLVLAQGSAVAPFIYTLF